MLKPSIFFIIINLCTFSYALSEGSTRHSAANSSVANPPVAIGTPLNKKLSTEKTRKNVPAYSIFRGNNEKYIYFLQELVSFTQTQDGNLYDYIDPTVSGFVPIDPQLFEKIMMLKHLDKSEKERIALNKIDKFLTENYKTQTLPAKVYDGTDLPKPFYLKDLKKWTFDCVKRGDINALRAFLDNYNLLKIKDDEGYNLIAYAVMYNQYDIIELLIKRKININEINKYGASPLTIAARNNNLHAVKLLTQNHCKIHHRDQFGNTPIDYALINNNQEMYRYLLDRRK